MYRKSMRERERAVREAFVTSAIWPRLFFGAKGFLIMPTMDSPKIEIFFQFDGAYDSQKSPSL